MMFPEEPRDGRHLPPLMIDDGLVRLNYSRNLAVKQAVQQGRQNKEHPAGAIPPLVEEVMLFCATCGRHRVVNVGEQCPICAGEQ